ncbi:MULTISPECIES: quinone oxidoreductase family protein [unclassified Nocardioides]|uniref:quinone oxidoreductase family protein n=1 Tax=unclassified Nocardioides TaxID=2615069 RepID=UPI0006F1EAFF|nr:MULTISPECIES: zinc-binding dehydrogenase [unclassified Nocardioides]KQY50883.1 oxidoreductase [Nocardioides sp. Root140]KQZ75626.1 oxidoreductase [Nocardioides sp. Root151]
MKAVRQRSYGDASVLELAEVPDPVAEPGWTVVELRAAALNWHDVLVRQGKYGSPLPHTPGADGAGIDLSTGDEVVVLPSLWWGSDESAPGPDWEILGDHRPGTYAERVLVPTEAVAPKPAGLSWAQAAALPLVGVTTHRALFTRGRLRAGESLLVLGAGGGVATMAVSLASAIGARVFVTSSSDDKIVAAQELGAHGGVRYDDPAWPTAVRELAGGRGFDVVLDPVGNWAQALEVLRPGGRLVVLGANRADTAELGVRPYYFGQFDLLGTTMGSPRDFAGLLDLMAEHAVPPPVIDRTFALDLAADAHRHLEAGGGFGKVVLEI